MLLPKPDFIVKEITQPHGLWCKSGHVAAPTHQREPLLPATPTRFFRVKSDKMPEVSGIYCEPCLMVAHAMAGR